MTLVLVDRDALDALLREMVDLREAYAIEGGALAPSKGEVMYLDPRDKVVTLAVQAGLLIPGPLEPGTVPPVPPNHPFDPDRVFTIMRECEARLDELGGERMAATYRADDDPRLRCVEDGKVVYTSMEAAEHAAKRISGRQPMRAYHGRCGHYHVSRIKS